MKQKKIKKEQRPNREDKTVIYAGLLEKLDKMSVKDRFSSMVSAGIYTQKGKLTAHYGG